MALTAYAMKGDEAKALAAGCDGYLAKPYQDEELIQLIRQLLRGARTPAVVGRV